MIAANIDTVASPFTVIASIVDAVAVMALAGRRRKDDTSNLLVKGLVS
jgi:hypothetical protein